jgi:gamma-glutamyltranspeptidase/glutathione hydrolase
VKLSAFAFVFDGETRESSAGTLIADRADMARLVHHDEAAAAMTPDVQDVFDSRMGPAEKARPPAVASPPLKMPPFPLRPEIRGSFGVISTSHWIATAVGMAALERGGNAFDAAVTAAFTLHLVLPEHNGIAGEVAMLIHPATSRDPLVLCGLGVAPRRATPDQFQSLGLGAVPERGFLAAITPGAFDAWMLLLRDHGRMHLREVLEPAIFYALQGSPPGPLLLHQLARNEKFFATEWPSTAAVLEELRPGTSGLGNRNAALAETLRRLLTEAESTGADRIEQIEAARRQFASGFIAQAIDRAARVPHASVVGGERMPGLITGEDVANWTASYEAPITYRHGDLVVAKAGPWTQGPVFLQQLAILGSLGIEKKFVAKDVAFAHAVIESAKLAFADRENFYGDPAFTAVPIDTLMSPEYASARAALIGPRSGTYAPGEVSARTSHLLKAGCALPEDDPERQWARRTGQHPGATVSLAVSDAEGNMVCAVPSGGTVLESPLILELGFALGSRGSGFRLLPGHPNCIAPGKRPRVTLSPTMVTRDGLPLLACGTAGGDQQEQWQMLFFQRYFHSNLNLQAAIEAPVYQTEHFPCSFPPFRANPNRVVMEPRFAPELGEELRRRGHEVTQTRRDWMLGAITAVARDGPLLKAGACPRYLRGYAAGR